VHRMIGRELSWQSKLTAVAFVYTITKGVYTNGGVSAHWLGPYLAWQC